MDVPSSMTRWCASRRRRRGGARPVVVDAVVRVPSSSTRWCASRRRRRGGARPVVVDAVVRVPSSSTRWCASRRRRRGGARPVVVDAVVRTSGSRVVCLLFTLASSVCCLPLRRLSVVYPCVVCGFRFCFREMGSRAQLDLAELKQDIINCRGLWALIDKWRGPAKAFRLGQITYRIYEVAREMFGGGTERGQGSAPVENRLSVACHESSVDLFDDVDRSIASIKETLSRRADLSARLHIVEGIEKGVEVLRERSKELKETAKSIERELQDIILIIDSFM